MDENLFDGTRTTDRVEATAPRRRRATATATATDAIVPIIALYVWAGSYAASLFV